MQYKKYFFAVFLLFTGCQPANVYTETNLLTEYMAGKSGVIEEIERDWEKLCFVYKGFNPLRTIEIMLKRKPDKIIGNIIDEGLLDYIYKIVLVRDSTFYIMNFDDELYHVDAGHGCYNASVAQSISYSNKDGVFHLKIGE